MRSPEEIRLTLQANQDAESAPLFGVRLPKALSFNDAVSAVVAAWDSVPGFRSRGQEQVAKQHVAIHGAEEIFDQCLRCQGCHLRGDTDTWSPPISIHTSRSCPRTNCSRSPFHALARLQNSCFHRHCCESVRVIMPQIFPQERAVDSAAERL